MTRKQNSSTKAVDAIFKKSGRIIWKLAKQYIKYLPAESVMCDEDLFMEGMAVYCSLINTFDAAKGIKFTTYLYSCTENRFKTIIKREIKKYNFSYYAVPISMFDKPGNQSFSCRAPEELTQITLCHIISDELSFESKRLLAKILDLKIPEKIGSCYSGIENVIDAQTKKIPIAEWIKILSTLTDSKSSQILKLRQELITITKGNPVDRVQVAAAY